MVRLKKSGHSIEKIAELLNRDNRTIRKYLFLAGAKESQLLELHSRHVDRVIRSVDLLRSCLINPKLVLIPKRREYPLELNGQDWRLEPLTWFRLCTPDLSNEELWGPEFFILKQHMKESPFWKHYYQLWQEAIKLDKAYQDVARNLGQRDREFNETWREIEKHMVHPYHISRIPDDPEPDWEQYKSCCDRAQSEKLIKMLIRVIPDLVDQQCGLEQLLEQLHQDLLPDEIEPLIVSGHCDNCP